MYKTLVKIVLELFVFEHCISYDKGVVERFKDFIYRQLHLSSDFDEFIDALNHDGIMLSKNSWIMVRNFIHYLDNFGMDDKM